MDFFVEEEKKKGLRTRDQSCSSPYLPSGVLSTGPMSNDFLPVHHLGIDACCLMAQLQEVQCWSSPDTCAQGGLSPLSPSLPFCG